MARINKSLNRASNFAERLGLQLPVLLAPMAGACPASLSIAVANAGGLGACGVLLMSPDQIAQWVNDFHAGSAGLFQLNNWIPDPPAGRDADNESRIQAFLSSWEREMGHDGESSTAFISPLDFDAQCEAMLAASLRLYRPSWVYIPSPWLPT